MGNLTELRKTVETGMDPRLQYEPISVKRWKPVWIRACNMN